MNSEANGGRKPRVYVTRNIPQEGLDILAEKCEVTQWLSDDPIPHDALLKNVQGIDGLICLVTDHIDQEVFDAAGPQLKVVSTMSVGYDHVNLDDCRQRNVRVSHTPGASTDVVAELGVGLLLATARRFPEGIDKVKDGHWGAGKATGLQGRSLYKSTVGMMGLGRIGYGVAQRLKPFGVTKFLYYDIRECSYASDLPADFVTFETLVKESDFIVLCCNLTTETEGLFNKDVFLKMKRSAVIVNISRGGIINHEDLYEALSTGEIGGAGMDVTCPEPLPPDNPLQNLKNCIILPHFGANTAKTRITMAEMAAQNIIAGLEGKPMPAEVKL